MICSFVTDGRRRVLVGLLALLALALAAPAVLADAPPEGEEAGAVEGIRALVRRVMADWHVPGVAVAIVKDGRPLLVEGFGLRNLEQGLPVTPETLFGIGSATKAFTATTFQALVEQGRLDWDTPVRAYLTGFHLSDPFATERTTPRDLASHRSGLRAVDLPFIFNPELDVPNLVANLDSLEPASDLRTTFAYNNLGYVILGQILAQVTGEPWSQAVDERIVAPLQMNATVFSLDEMMQGNNFAYPYTYSTGHYGRLEFLPIEAAGPAGAIHSNVVDMSRWVAMQLHQGALDGQAIVSPDGLAATHTAQITMGAPSQPPILHQGYGLGWFVESYRGYYHVHHGGSTAGHSTQVSLLPHEGIGIVILSNTPSPLPLIVARHAMDLLLGLEPIDWNGQLQASVEAHSGQEPVEEPAAGVVPAPPHPLEDYAGSYTHPVYGTLQITPGEDALEATYYALSIPLTHVHYDQFQGPIERFPGQVPFRFETGLAGDVTRLWVDFETDGHPIAFERQAEERLRDPVFLGRLAGIYSLQGQTVVFAVVGDALRMTLPGQPPYNLVPQQGLRFELKEVPAVQVEFVLDDPEAPASRALVVQGGIPFELERMQ